MPIFKLSQREGLTEEGRDEWVAASASPRDVWSCWVTPMGFVVVAADMAQARAVAAEATGSHEAWWLDPSVVVCEQVSDDGSPRVVMVNMPTG